MSNIYDKIPNNSIKYIKKWINHLDLKIILRNDRKTKLGDFRPTHNNLTITINKNLNPYLFLITLTHEIAHAFVWQTHKSSVSPHGKEWKEMYKSLMLNFLNPDIFPEDIIKNLSKHLISPSASTTTDIILYSCLRQYDSSLKKTISDIKEGEIFYLSNQRKFIKGVRLRKRFRCIEVESKKIYLMHPLIEVFETDT
ncbi:MAG: SprT-like domain-containing protein [Bacteroidota bacterium]|nr:SprT-like domain-containing protein [Bacteroidota bacterium]